MTIVTSKNENCLMNHANQCSQDGRPIIAIVSCVIKQNSIKEDFFLHNNKLTTLIIIYIITCDDIHLDAFRLCLYYYYNNSKGRSACPLLIYNFNNIFISHSINICQATNWKQCPVWSSFQYNAHFSTTEYNALKTAFLYSYTCLISDI